jgi:hypothetical protein
MVTEKQWKVIRFIENNLGIKFKGQWKEQATVFIEMNIEQSKRVATEYYLEMRRIRLWEMENDEHVFDAEDYYEGLDWYDFT